VIRKSALYTCFSLATAMIAIGCSRREDMSSCRTGNPDARIAGCTALLKADQHTTKNRAVIYGIRGVAFYSKGDYDRAIQDTNQAILLNPNEPSFYDTRGVAYKKKSDFDRAIQDFNEAILLNPNFERAYYDRGGAYIDKDDYDRAIQDFDEAIHLNSNDANVYNNRGVAYLKRGDYDHAIQDFNQTIRLDSNYTTAYGNRGDAYFSQANLAASIADYEHTISAAPSSKTAVYAVLMLHVIVKRQSQDDAQQLGRVAAEVDLSKWPGPLLKLDLGQMTAGEAIMAAASSGNDRQKKWQVCEANYFTGEDALLHHQRTTALARLKAARDGCPKGEGDYVAALAELKRLGVPAAPAK
jgi:lipoprotein NlpI